MSFNPKDWQNRREGMTTPIDAAGLIDMETRLATYTELLKSAEIVSELPEASEGIAGQFRLVNSELGEDALFLCVWNGGTYEWRSIDGTADTDPGPPPVTLDKRVIGAAGGIAFGSGWQAPDATDQPLQYSQNSYSTFQAEGFVRPTTPKTADSNILATPLSLSYRPLGRVPSSTKLPIGRVVIMPSGMFVWEKDRWPVENTGAGITAAAVPSVANSGGESGDAFSQVVNDATLTAATDQLLGNALLKRSFKVVQGVTPAEAYVKYSSLPKTSRVFGRIYCRWDGGFGTGSAQRIVRFFNGSSGLATITIKTDNAAPDLRFTAGANGSVFVAGNSALIFLVDTNYRIEWDITFGVGTARLEARIFAGANVNGLVPDDVFLVTAQDTNGLDTMDDLILGSVLNGPPSEAFWFGGLNANIEGYPGPYVGLKTKTLPAKVSIPISIKLVPDYTPVATPPPPAEADFIFAEQSVIEAMSRSSAGYVWMKARADDMMNRGLAPLVTPPIQTSPLLTNYHDNSTGYGRPIECLANALWYRRNLADFPAEAATRKARVIAYCQYIIGTEELPSTNGQSTSDASLATGRALAGYIMAADLVDMPLTTLGSRPGWTSTQWQDWLPTVRLKQIGTTPNKYTWPANFLLATNHSTMIMASQIAMAIHLGDADLLAESVAWVKRYVGETYAGDFNKSSGYRQSWVYPPDTSLVSWLPINPSIGGLGYDGIMVEECHRGVTDFEVWTDLGINYTHEALAGLLLCARLLDRQGYTDVWEWGAGASGVAGDAQSIRRVMDKMDRIGKASGNGRVMLALNAWIVNHYYGETYPTVQCRAHASHGFYDGLWVAGA